MHRRTNMFQVRVNGDGGVRRAMQELQEEDILHRWVFKWCHA